MGFRAALSGARRCGRPLSDAKQRLTIMSKLGILTTVALFATIAAARADNQVWTVQNWPGDIDLIPCSAWTKSGDGSWLLTGGSIKLGSETMSNIGVKGDAAAHKLDRECGGAKKK
jgi:hypothetical protein